MRKWVTGIPEGWLFMVLLWVSSGWATSADSLQHGVPWDSVVAEIQIIQGSRLPDSVKAQLLGQVFQKFDLEMSDYQAFYQQFRRWSNERVVRFLHRVETIIKARAKQPIRVSEKKPPKLPEPPPSGKP
ncbi:MAG: hypothetical protein GXO78_14415 [Calditrichaeota bacterium]|nr:hypothetical protein [Calditrichota bacterium]